MATLARTLLLALVVLAGACAEPFGGDVETEAPRPTGSSKEEASRPGAASPDAPQEKRATDLFFRTFGDRAAPPVVYLHGGPGANSFDFESSAAQALADRGFFVIAYDQRGCGRSPLGVQGDYGYARATEDLEVLLTSLDVREPILLGHSFGGSIALKFLELHPGVAKGAVLLGSPIDFPAMYATIADRVADFYRATLRGSKAEEVARVKTTMFPRGVASPFTYGVEEIGLLTTEMIASGLALPKPPTAKALALQAKMKLDRENGALSTAMNKDLGVGYQANDQVGYQNLVPLLAKHGARVYAAYGEQDGIFDDAQLDAIKGAIGTDHFATIPRAAHFSYVDQTDSFVDVVSAQLTALK